MKVNSLAERDRRSEGEAGEGGGIGEDAIEEDTD